MRSEMVTERLCVDNNQTRSQTAGMINLEHSDPQVHITLSNQQPQ